MIRALTADDWRAMARLRHARDTHAGASVDSFTFAPITSVNTRYQVAPHFVVGAFADGDLKAFICAYGGADFWVLDLMVCDELDQLHPCLQRCLEHYEAAGIQQFFYAFPKKWARAYRSFWRDSTPALRRYRIEDIGAIDPYKVPTDAWIWEHILHETVVPVPLLLRRSRQC